MSSDNTQYLNSENEIYKEAFINANDSIFLIAEDGSIIDANNKAVKSYGYTYNELINMYIWKLTSPNILNKVENQFNNAILKKVSFETTHYRKDSTSFPVEVCSVNIGKKNIVVSTIKDITEQKENELKLLEKYNELKKIYEELYETEEELRQYYKKLFLLKAESDRLNEAKNQFLSNVSRDAAILLNGITCIMELLSGTELSDGQSYFMNMINMSASFLEEILKKLLDDSKTEVVKFQLIKEPFNLRDNIEKIIKEFWLVGQNKGIEIMYFIEPFINLDLIGDPLRLNQVLINLINNAIKFTEKGHVYVRVNKVSINNNTIKILFSVEDTGIGISDEVKDNFFKVSNQGYDSFTRKVVRTGRGLEVDKEIIDMMNGDIWVVSKEGEGSTFYFTAEYIVNNSAINFSNNKDKDCSELNTYVSCNTNKVNILVVDDNEINKKVASAMVFKKGYNCLCASNGKQAIEMLEKEKIHLILMDIQMPELNGFEATKIIRENEENTAKHIPIIAMTAYALVEDRQKCIDAGMDDYIPKPIDANELYKKIENYIAR